MDNHSFRPILDPANYGPWLLALRSAAYTADCIDHFRSNSPKPQDADGIKDYEKKQNYLLGKIIGSIPSEIANLLLTPTSDPTPYDLIAQIKQHLDTTNANDHKYLKQQAEETHFLPDTSLEEYVKQHENIRAHMIAAQYPDISDRKTTVEFMIDGLKHNPFTAPIGLQLLALNPTDIKDFVHKYKRISSYQAASSIIPPPHGVPSTPPASSPVSVLTVAETSIVHVASRPATATPISTPASSTANVVSHTHSTPTMNATTQNTAGNRKPSNPRPEVSVLNNPITTTIRLYPLAPTMILVTKHKTVNTITATNDKRPCTHIGQMTVVTDKHTPITLPAVCNPAFKQTLLSVRDITHKYGNVLFTPKAILYDRKQNKIIGTAPWTPSIQAYSWKPQPNFSAHAARSKPHRPRKTQDKPIQPNKTPPNPSPTIPKTPRRVPPPSTLKRNIVRISHQATSTPPHQPQLHTTIKAFHDWHLRLNHTPPRTLQQMTLSNTLSDLPSELRHNPPKLTCSSCAHAKQRPAPHPSKQHNYPVATYISSDTCGPINPTSRHGNNHFLTFVDAASRYLILYFLKTRKEVGIVVPAFFSLIRNRYGKTPSIYRSDNAKEFQSKDMQNTYLRQGIEYRNNTPYQSQENSIAERINQTLMNAARAALHHANLDDTFWEDSVRDAAFKKNIMLHTSHGKSPYEVWHGSVPTSKHLFTFGQLGTATIHSPKRKLQPRADPARYMYGISRDLIMVFNLRTNRYQQLRHSDFRQYNHEQDPTYQQTHARRASNTHIFPPYRPASPQPRQNPNPITWPAAIPMPTCGA